VKDSGILCRRCYYWLDSLRATEVEVDDGSALFLQTADVADDSRHVLCLNITVSLRKGVSMPGSLVTDVQYGSNSRLLCRWKRFGDQF
jgi:hypothetical protein